MLIIIVKQSIVVKLYDNLCEYTKLINVSSDRQNMYNIKVSVILCREGERQGRSEGSKTREFALEDQFFGPLSVGACTCSDLLWNQLYSSFSSASGSDF